MNMYIQNKVTQQKRQLFFLLVEHFFQSVLSFDIILNLQVCAHIGQVLSENKR